MDGRVDNTCHKGTGKCECKTNIEGKLCDSCKPLHYAFPQCHGKFYDL